MVKMGAREFVYPNFGYRSIWLRNRDPVYQDHACQARDNTNINTNGQWKMVRALRIIDNINCRNTGMSLTRTYAVINS